MANLSNINNKFLVTTGGNVLIGQTSAVGTPIFQVTGVSTFSGNVSTGNLTVTNTTSGWTAYINNNIGSGTQSGLLLDAGSSSADFAMYVRNAAGSSDFFAIKGNGNLGIGTSLPEGKLDVVDGNAIMTFKAGSSDRPYLQLRHDAVPVDGEELAIMDFSGYNDASQNTRYVILTAKAEDVTDGSEDGSLSLLTMKDGTATNTMSLRSGSVGIGTTSPGTKLQVGDGTADDTIRTVFSDGSYTDIHGYGLEMSRGFSYIRPTTSNTQTLYIGDQAAGNNWSVISNNASTHIWRNSSSERMRIDSSGRVGIGTTSPNQLLEVANSAGGATISISTDQQPGSQAAKKYMNLDFTGYNNDVMSRIQSWDESSSTGHGNLTFSTRNASTALLSQRMIIDYAGRVGIGTSDVEETLTIAKTDGGDGTIVGLRSDASFSQFEIATKNSQVDWGLQTIGARNMYFTTNASERMRIDSSGFTTITHSGAGASLTLGQSGGISINENVGFLNFYSNDPSANSSGGVGGIGVYGETAFGGNTPSYMSFFTHDTSPNDGTVLGNVTERMRITSAGDVLIHGTYNPYSQANRGNITLGGSNSNIIAFTNNSSGKAYIYHNGLDFEINNGVAGVLKFATNSTERMRITGGGTVLFGKSDTSTNTIGFRIDGADSTLGRVFASITNPQFTYYLRDTTNLVYRFYVSGTGQIYATSTSISGASDITLKENIKPLETGLDEVMRLQPRRFDWKNGDGKNIAGFVAQEVEEILPDLVGDYKYNDEETKKSLKMGDMIPTLVKAIQELKADNDSLKARIETLENN